MTLRHRLGHGVMRRLVAWGERSFRRSLNDLEGIQRRKLNGLMTAVAATSTAKRFDINAETDWQRFAERVPVSGYKDWSDAIAAQRDQGEAMVASPILRYQPTSGSTSAIKWIPYSQRFLGELDAAIVPWLADLYRQFPDISRGSHYWSLSWMPTDMRDQGSADLNDDMKLLSAGKRLLAAATQAVPETIALAPTSEDAAFATLVRLVGDRDLSVISVWSPTFMLTLLEQLGQWREQVAVCLERGHWCDRHTALHFIPCPRQQAQAALLRRWDGKPDAGFFAELWPNLALISAWDTASATRWAKVLHGSLSHAGFQGKGLWATEGVVTIPYGSDHLLAYQSHVYEFEDLDSGKILAPWQLRSGQQVAPVVSTGSGFLRYRMGDQLQVSGFRGSVPALTFLGREDGVDLVGEKISTLAAQQVLDAVAEGFDARTVSLIALEQSDAQQRPGYVLLLEHVGRSDDDKIAEAVESLLQEHFHYRLARSLNQLTSARVVTADDMRDFYLLQCRDRGMIEGNIKIEPLRRWDGVTPARLLPVDAKMKVRA